MELLPLYAMVLAALFVVAWWSSHESTDALIRLATITGIYVAWSAAALAIGHLAFSKAGARETWLGFVQIPLWLGLLYYAGRFRSPRAIEMLILVYVLYGLTQLMDQLQPWLGQRASMTNVSQMLLVLLATRWCCASRATRSIIRPREVIAVATWTAVVAAGIELLGGMLQAGRLGTLTTPWFQRVAGDEHWIAFAANLGICWILGAILAGCVTLWPRVFYRRWVVVLLLSIGMLGISAPFENLFGPWVLLVGLICLWTGQAFIPEVAFERGPALMRRSLPALLVVAAVWSVGTAWLADIESAGTDPLARPASEASLAPSGTPNVLLVTLSSVGAESLSFYGLSRETSPELARWAERGVVFEQAWSVGSWSFPVHATLFAGQYPYEHGVDWATPLGTTQPTLAEKLAEQGYDCVGLVANGWYLGPAGGLDRGFTEYAEIVPWWRPWVYATSLARFATAHWFPLPRADAATLNHRFLDWLDHHPKDRPYFAFLNYFDAHAPYQVPDDAFDRFSALSPAERQKRRAAWERELGSAREAAEDAEVELAQDTYLGAVAYLDAQLGLLLEELNRRGELANTWVIVAGDNGEQFGAHDQYGHGYNLYHDVLHVPLLILPPSGEGAGQRVTTPVSLLDVPRTIAEVARVELPETFRGNSLTRFWRNETTDAQAPTPLLAQEPRGLEAGRLNYEGPIQSLVWQHWHYLRYDGQNRESLFDLEQDPDELVDLATTEAGKEILPGLRTKLNELLSAGESGGGMRYRAPTNAN